MSDLTLDVGLAAKLKVAFARNGWTEQLIDAACEGDKLGQFRQVLLGHAAITVVEHVIDCDADPVKPWSKDGWTVDEHQKGGKWKFDPKRVELYLSSGQKESKYIGGDKLRKELAQKPVFNANVLDYLLANPHLIPEEWKGKYIFFWGTIYRSPDGDLYARCLCWDDGTWYWSYDWLGSDWLGRNPAAVRAS